MKPKLLRLFSISRNAYVWGCVSHEGAMGRGDTLKDAFDRWAALQPCVVYGNRLVGTSGYGITMKPTFHIPPLAKMLAPPLRSQTPAYVEVPVPESPPWWRFW